MLNLTNQDADRLAQLLDTSEHLIRNLASEHAAKADAMAYLRDNRLREYHRAMQERAINAANECAEASKRARERKPWVEPRRTTPIRQANRLKRTA